MTNDRGILGKNAVFFLCLVIFLNNRDVLVIGA